MTRIGRIEATLVDLPTIRGHVLAMTAIRAQPIVPAGRSDIAEAEQMIATRRHDTFGLKIGKRPPPVGGGDPG